MSTDRIHLYYVLNYIPILSLALQWPRNAYRPYIQNTLSTYRLCIAHNHCENPVGSPLIQPSGYLYSAKETVRSNPEQKSNNHSFHTQSLKKDAPQSFYYQDGLANG